MEVSAFGSVHANQALYGPGMARPVFRAKRKGHASPTKVSLSKFRTKENKQFLALEGRSRQQLYESSKVSPCGREKNCHSILNTQSGPSLERLNL